MFTATRIEALNRVRLATHPEGALENYGGDRKVSRLAD